MVYLKSQLVRGFQILSPKKKTPSKAKWTVQNSLGAVKGLELKERRGKNLHL